MQATAVVVVIGGLRFNHKSKQILLLNPNTNFTDMESVSEKEGAFTDNIMSLAML